MRLTSRERFMLIGFLVLLSVAGLIYYVYLPVFDALTLERSKLQENERTLASIERNIMPLETQKSLINSFKRKVEIMERTLPPIIYQEEVIRSVSQVFEANEVEDISYSFGTAGDRIEKDGDEEAIGKIISGYEDTLLDNFSKSMVEARFENQNESDTEEEEGWESVVNTIDATVEISGAYENIKNVIAQLESFDNIVLIKNLSIAKDNNFVDRVVGTIDLQFPYYYDNETLAKLNWLYESEFEEHSPFDYIVTGSLADPDRPITSAGSGSSSGIGSITGIPGLDDTLLNNLGGGENNSTSQESTRLDPDFEVIMSAPTSINNKYYISKADQSELSLYSQRDSENLSITLTESAGKLAFYYSTSFTNFPGVNEYYSFSPNYQDAVYITVVSTPRVDEKDVGMGTLSVYNKTGRPVKIFVKTDDNKLPRLLMGTTEGDVQVIR